MMRGLILTGLLVMVVGLFMLFLPSRFVDRNVSMAPGVTHTETHTLTIPSWTGGAVVVLGVVVALVGASIRPRSY